jgi:hypothetical protein
MISEMEESDISDGQSDGGEREDMKAGILTPNDRFILIFK